MTDCSPYSEFAFHCFEALSDAVVCVVLLVCYGLDPKWVEGLARLIVLKRAFIVSCNSHGASCSTVQALLTLVACFAVIFEVRLHLSSFFLFNDLTVCRLFIFIVYVSVVRVLV